MERLADSYINDLNNAIKNTIGIEELYKKKILITGVTGLIGAFLVDLILFLNEKENANIEIYALARNESRAKERFEYAKSSKLKFIIQDVCDPIIIEDKVDYVIHAAGDGYPEAFRVRPVETMTPALLGTINTLNLAKNNNSNSYVLISSGEVYGNVENVEELEEPLTYTALGMNSRSCYPVAKQTSEILCASYFSEYCVPVKVARLSHTYGPFFAINDNRAATQFIKKANKGEDIILHSKGEQKRSYTYVADAAAGILTVLIRGENGEAYNVSNHDSKGSICEFAHVVAKLANVECRFEVPNEQQLKEKSPIASAVLSSKKIEGLGFKGTYTLEDGLKATLSALHE